MSRVKNLTITNFAKNSTHFAPKTTSITFLIKIIPLNLNLLEFNTPKIPKLHSSIDNRRRC
jgi:hypothetical protein